MRDLLAIIGAATIALVLLGAAAYVEGYVEETIRLRTKRVDKP